MTHHNLTKAVHEYLQQSSHNYQKTECNSNDLEGENG